MIEVCLCTICGKEFRPFFSWEFTVCNDCAKKKDEGAALGNYMIGQFVDAVEKYIKENPLKQKEQKMSEPITSVAIEIKPQFKVHLLNESGIDKAKTMAFKFSDLLHWLESEAGCLQGRELSLVKTKLEEASFFAKKAMAQNPANQK